MSFGPWFALYMIYVAQMNVTLMAKRSLIWAVELDRFCVNMLHFSSTCDPRVSFNSDTMQVCMMIAALSNASRFHAFFIFEQNQWFSVSGALVSKSWIILPVMPINFYLGQPSNFRCKSCTFLRTWPHVSSFSFENRCQDRGFKHSPIQLIHGDFLKNCEVRKAVSTAGLVYMNNPKFGPELNLQVLSKWIHTHTRAIAIHATTTKNCINLCSPH